MKNSAGRRAGWGALCALSAAISLGACTETITDESKDIGPLEMAIVSGNQQTAPPGTELPAPLVVRVVDGSGRPVSNQIVNFIVTSGGGSVYAGTALTNSQGLAQERWTLGPNTGTQRLEARAVDASSGDKRVFASFTATAATQSSSQVASVSVSPATVSLAVGATQRLTATARTQSGTTVSKTFTWTSSNTNVATVSSNGTVTARAGGIATITATTDGIKGTAVVTVSASAPPPSDPGTNNMYFNSAEVGCGTSSNVIFCDDFEDGDWYIKNCDQANASGGLLQTDGWCGTIYANSLLQAGTARCGGAGFRSNCAATTGVMAGSSNGNMADHAFVNGQGTNEVWVRFYMKPLSGYQFGAEKILTFNDNTPGWGGIKWGNLHINCGTGSAQSSGSVQMQFTTPMSMCQNQNVGTRLTMQPGNWYFFEVHYKLSSPGGSDGVFELWMDNCGPSGTSCPASPTLRMRRTDVRNDRRSTSEQIRVLWFESWANPVSRGERLIDQIKVSKTGPIGFMQ